MDYTREDSADFVWYLSVLPFLNKVFIKALHSRISEFYENYKVIDEEQYGFLKNKSTTKAILEFTLECSVLNSKEYLVSVFIKFSKTFYTIYSTILYCILIKKTNGVEKG